MHSRIPLPQLSVWLYTLARIDLWRKIWEASRTQMKMDYVYPARRMWLWPR